MPLISIRYRVEGFHEKSERKKAKKEALLSPGVVRFELTHIGTKIRCLHHLAIPHRYLLQTEHTVCNPVRKAVSGIAAHPPLV